LADPHKSWTRKGLGAKTQCLTHQYDLKSTRGMDHL